MPSKSNIPEGFSDGYMWQRVGDGHLIRDEKYDVENEREFVTKICVSLELRGIPYKLERDIGGRHADIVISQHNLAIECKRRDWKRLVEEGVEQCNSYREGGFTPVLVVPPRTENKKENEMERLVSSENIPYFEFDVKRLTFNAISTEGYFETLILI